MERGWGYFTGVKRGPVRKRIFFLVNTIIIFQWYFHMTDVSPAKNESLYTEHESLYLQHNLATYSKDHFLNVVKLERTKIKEEHIVVRHRAWVGEG